MMHWDDAGAWNGWAWFAMGLSMVLFTVAVGLIIWLLVRRSTGSPAPTSAVPTAEEVLRQRFATGEIDQADFDQRMAALRTNRRPSVPSGS